MDEIKPNICARCGHSWFGRNPNVSPTRCGKCKAKYWDREINEPKIYNKKKSFVHGNDKYGFGSIEIGNSKLIPWSVYTISEKASLSPEKERLLNADKAKIYPAAMKYALRNGKKFTVSALPQGLLILRSL